MMRLSRRLSWSTTGAAALSLLFFVLYYLYLWMVVDLRLIYHGGGVVLNFPVFYLEWEFFQKTALSPGGLVEYVSAFLAQFFYIGWAGTLIATIQVWLIWLCTGSILRRAGGRQLDLVCFTMPILLLTFYTWYEYPFGIAMDLLAALGFVNLYMWASSKPRPKDLATFMVLSIICYITAGGAYLLFAAVCGIWELLIRRRPTIVVAFLLTVAAVLYIVSTIVFDVGIIDILNNFMPRFDRGELNYAAKITIAYLLDLLTPMALIGLWLAELLSRTKSSRTPTDASSKIIKENKENRFSRFIAWSAGKAASISALVAIVAGALVVSLCYDSRVKTLIAVDYYASNKMWREVLETSSRFPNHKFINQAVNRALYHTGRLGDDMFLYQQQPDALLMLSRSNPVCWWWGFDTCIDLGHMNVAEYYLVFCMDTYGERPIFLKRRALVNMVKGNLGTARVCLGTLSKTLFDAGWAREYLEKIEADPNLSTDKEFQQLRSMMPAIDRDFGSLNENIFLDLLDKNKHNRMAFEYLEAFYLLTIQLDKFVANLNRLNDFDYAGIPRVYEEAILLYGYNTKKKFEVPGREISAESRERFNNFLKVLFGRYGGDKKAAFYELAKDYGDSYFFYSAYGLSGMKQ
jgi:hypothetical protein